MTGLILTLVSGIFFLIGSLIALFIKKKKELISFSIGISFTVLILLVILDILPETLSIFNEYQFLTIGGGVLIGIGILMLSEKFIPHHSHHENKQKHNHHLIHIGIMTSISIIIHNLIEGICIYGVTTSSFKAGLSYALAVGLHNIPFGINITTIFKETKSTKKIWIFNALLILSTFLGALIIHLFNNELNEFILGTMLSITMGMIIYIIIWELFIELKESFNRYSFLGIITGILFMLVSTLI